MIQNKAALNFKIYPPEAQAVGQFDGGRITEVKPIGFPHEGPPIKNLGPLFYWAWATAKGYGKIALHPHQAFEIMSYALEGEIGHYDSLGNRSRVQAGGAQVIQAGAGISHEEETIGEFTDFFQIWFDPNIRKTIHNNPTYNEFKNDDFLIEHQDGVTLKTILGNGSPIYLESEVIMQDISIENDRLYQYVLAQDRTLAVVIISGKGILFDKQTGAKHHVNKQDFAVIHAKQRGEISIQADSSSPLRIATIEVPAQVDYPLYRNQ
ncbi:MAG: pirin [Nitrospina sp.]|jgi:quercetin 2,3-dioxygenase|nr:pirin [Nitrospina sp.]MBT3507926.1 pirin [Nitrospina sp.]MBT3876452.1 pirin [Nitrospina sp.]MBT4048727.1 pirin [Nitrospina sp.]MBT4558038.1 pirin [Nitrospina sp.]